MLFSSNYLDLELSKYGIDWASDENLENLKREIDDAVQGEISSILHPDKFMISLTLGEGIFIITDSTHVRTQTDEEYHNKMKIMEVCHIPALIEFSEDLQVHMQYEPTITVYIDNSVSTDGLKLTIKQLINEMLYQYTLGLYDVKIDFSKCDDIIHFRSVNIDEYKSQNQQARRNTSNPIYMKKIIDNIYIYQFLSSELKQIILDNIEYNEDEQDIRL